MKKIIVLAVVIGLFTSFKQKEITWLALGDSITYLNDHPDETGNRITSGYMTQVIKKLPNIHFINQGHNGWTAVQIAKEIENLGLIKADVYSVFLGTNDWWSGRPLGSLSDYSNNTGDTTVYGAFRVIINKFKQLNPDAKIILITPMRRVDFVYINDKHNNAYGSYREKNGQTLEQIAAAIQTIATREHFPLVNLYAAKKLGLKHLVKYKRVKDPQTGAYKNYSYPDFIDVPFNPDTDEYPYPPEAADMTFDGLHPSDKGYTVIADMLVKLMKKY